MVSLQVIHSILSENEKRLICDLIFLKCLLVHGDNPVCVKSDIKLNACSLPFDLTCCCCADGSDFHSCFTSDCSTVDVTAGVFKWLWMTKKTFTGYTEVLGKSQLFFSFSFLNSLYSWLTAVCTGQNCQQFTSHTTSLQKCSHIYKVVAMHCNSSVSQTFLSLFILEDRI